MCTCTHTNTHMNTDTPEKEESRLKGEKLIYVHERERRVCAHLQGKIKLREAGVWTVPIRTGVWKMVAEDGQVCTVLRKTLSG